MAESKIERYGSASVARRVVEEWATKVQRDAEIMGENYLNGIRNANTEQMKISLGVWYKTALPQVSAKFRQIWSGAPAPIGR